MAEQNQEVIPQVEYRPPYNQLKTGPSIDQPNDDPDAAEEAREATKQRKRKSEYDIPMTPPPAHKVEEWAEIRRHPELLTAQRVISEVGDLLTGKQDDGSTLHVMLEERLDLCDAALQEAKRGVVSADPHTRAAAFGVLWEVAANAGDLAPEVLGLAKSATKDQDGYVREMALATIGRCVYQRPDLADSALDSAKSAMTDADAFVRGEAYKVMARVTYRRHDLAATVLDCLKVGMNDADDGVREEAYEALRDVVAARPELGETALESVKKGVAAGNGTRLGAMEALPAIARARPDLDDAALSLARTVADDSDVAVRLRAMDTLGEIGVQRPDLRDAVIPLLEKAARDDPDKLVRDAAQYESLGSIQHAISSGTGGKSDAPAKQENRTLQQRGAMTP